MGGLGRGCSEDRRSSRGGLGADVWVVVWIAASILSVARVDFGHDLVEESARPAAGGAGTTPALELLEVAGEALGSSSCRLEQETGQQPGYHHGERRTGARQDGLVQRATQQSPCGIRFHVLYCYQVIKYQEVQFRQKGHLQRW